MFEQITCRWLNAGNSAIIFYTYRWRDSRSNQNESQSSFSIAWMVVYSPSIYGFMVMSESNSFAGVSSNDKNRDQWARWLLEPCRTWPCDFDYQNIGCEIKLIQNNNKFLPMGLSTGMMEVPLYRLPRTRRTAGTFWPHSLLIRLHQTRLLLRVPRVESAEQIIFLQSGRVPFSRKVTVRREGWVPYIENAV